MSWKRWGALETLFGLILGASIWPLDRLHFWTAMVAFFAFCPCYLHRYLEANAAKNRGEL